MTIRFRTLNSRNCPDSAASSRRWTPLMRAILLGWTAIALAGCSSGSTDVLSEVGAVGVGGAVGTATGSPVIGILAGIGTSFALDEGYNFVERSFYESKQGAIASTAGRTPTGQVAAWTHRGPLDVTASRGRLEVVRRFGQMIACKEFIYTAEPLPAERLEKAGTFEGGGPVAPVDLETPVPAQAEVLVATACETPDGLWRWAQSRPSTARWGGLQ